MLQYLLKRILIFIPTLLVISLLAFALSKAAPGDPAEPSQDEIENANSSRTEEMYAQKARRLGLDKPVFYGSISPVAYPDTLYKITHRYHRENLSKLIAQYGNWPQIEQYFYTLKQFDQLYEREKDALKGNKTELNRSIPELFTSHQDQKIQALMANIDRSIQADSSFQQLLASPFQELQDTYIAIKENSTTSLLYIPSIKWYGWDNQYHNWFSKFVRGDFGFSYRNGQPVAERMKQAIFWTLIMNGCAIFIAYLISIPLGVRTAVKKNSTFDRVSTLLLYILYSLPTFWIATLLVIFITNSEYGMDWFPSQGTGDLEADASFLARFLDTAYHLVLPIFCLTYASLAFITRQMRGGMLDVLRQDYIRTAWAKGLNEKKVVWKHAFRNSLFPIITLFASVFPAALAGSLVIEVIFNIPGMGKLTVDAIFARDWPIVYTVLMLAAVLTMAGMLVADILYAFVDPRVRFSKN